jgi:hypothetical protein
MMDADVEVRCNAGYGEVTPDRVNSRNGKDTVEISHEALLWALAETARVAEPGPGRPADSPRPDRRRPRLAGP